ncbi:MAG: FimB/Mfa2 family fimbrial subunit [Prevotella sp.]|jgi:hypothetical protein|nr:FimB/Mfa2 family fimbrial subunit [Prevotella sp.]
MKPVLLCGLLATLFLYFGSCKNTDDEFLPDDVLPPVPEGYVRMQITVPGLTPVSTYALGTADETHVSEVDVLVFGSDSKYLCHAAVTEPSKITGTGSTKTFDVDLRAAGNIASAYVMVVANAAVDTTGFASSRPTKETVMREKITFASSGKWNVAKTNDTDFTPLPMWGMTASPVSLAGTSSISSISLIRSVARIDVGLKFPDNVTDGTETATGLGSTFILEEVYLYNSLDKGSVAPYSSNYSGTTATAPSIPTPAPGVNNSPVPSYLSSNGTADGFTSNKSCMSAIYMAEHAAGTDALTNNPYLVIGGKYNGSGTVTYYRLDFVSGNYPNQEFLPVLRNHRYRFNITGVAGPGYTSAALAAAARPVNLTYDLSATDESLASYVYNGQYALGVSQDSYTLDNAAQSATLQVSTTCESGYTAVSSDPDWLRFGSTFGSGTATVTNTAANTLSTLTFSVAANSGAQRPATITITSGRLTKVVNVTQSNIDRFTVTGLPTTSPTYSVGGGDKTLTVTSLYEWSVNVSEDRYGIVKTFTSKGSGSGIFNFSLFSNLSNDYVPEATFTFFSPAGEFDPVEQKFSMAASTAAYVPSTTHKGWAGSNIYWNGTKLTFADTPSSPPSYTADPATPETYQGVFFKWGSLVGLDPSFSNSTYKPTGNAAWNGDCRVFVPDWNPTTPTSSSWTNRRADAVSVTTDGDDDTGAAVSPADFSKWDNIPYVSAGNTTNSSALAYLTKDADTDLSIGAAVTTPSTDGGHIPSPGVTVSVEKMKGDICRYLTQTGDAPGSPKVKWRMPTSDEFTGSNSEYATNSNRNDWTNQTTSTSITFRYDGMYQPAAGRRKTNDVIANYQPWFPSSGSRHYSTGAMHEVGIAAHHWTSSPGNSEAYRMAIYNNNRQPGYTYNRPFGLPVRCVKE